MCPDEFDLLSFVIAGLVPAISLMGLSVPTNRDGRPKAGPDDLRGLDRLYAASLSAWMSTLVIFIIALITRLARTGSPVIMSGSPA